MQTDMTLEVSYRSDDQTWQVGVLARTDGVIDLCRSHQCGPFTTLRQVVEFFDALMAAWAAPELGYTASESLHDVYSRKAP